MSVSDVVSGYGSRKAFGHGFYKTPSNEMLLKKTPFGCANKEAAKGFIDQASKHGKWVPPAKYFYNRDMLINVPHKKGMFLQRARYTMTDEVFIRGNVKEKCSAGPCIYKTDQVWHKQSQFAREKGTYKSNGERITFTEVIAAETEHSPPPNKYNAFRSFTEMRPGRVELKPLNFPRVDPAHRKFERSPSS